MSVVRRSDIPSDLPKYASHREQGRVLLAEEGEGVQWVRGSLEGEGAVPRVAAVE